MKLYIPGGDIFTNNQVVQCKREYETTAGVYQESPVSSPCP